MNEITFANVTLDAANVNAAIYAAEKFQDIVRDAFLNGQLSYNCQLKLNLFFSISFLKDIKEGDEFSARATVEDFEKECNNVDLAYELYGDEIKRNKHITSALEDYNSALKRMCGID